jgi:hypothetical protein
MAMRMAKHIFMHFNLRLSCDMQAERSCPPWP